MGLGVHLVEGLVRENKYQQIRGQVLLLGRQTVYYGREQILTLMGEHGYDISGIAPESIELDSVTHNRLPGTNDQEFISDVALLRLLGASEIKALDHSAYEGAEIIHDLSRPVPDSLVGIADFIIDGSTLDNVFDPVMLIKNVSRMLKPGGRVLSMNAFSPHNTPYVMVPPMWYLDYFTVNEFADCKVYIVAWPSDRYAHVFSVNLEYLLDPNRWVSNLVFNCPMAVVVMAEMGSNSTWDVNPTQQDYRSSDDWLRFRHSLASINSSRRPHVVRTRGEQDLFGLPGGYLFIGDDFTASEAFSEPPVLQTLPEPAGSKRIRLRRTKAER